MQLDDFAKGSTWAIVPSRFDTLEADIHLMRSGNFSEQMAALPAQLADDRPYTVRDGVAVIPVTGPISRRQSIFSYFFGGTGLNVLADMFTRALADPQVEAIVFDIDSPGGTVNGVEAFTDMVFKARDQKPLVSFSSGIMASAAYWIGSAAHAIIIDPTAELGSIGILTVHHDRSRMDEKAGVKRTYLSVPGEKSLGNPAEPLSEAARAKYMGGMDHLYGVFTSTVARNRDRERDQVIARMATGLTYIGQQAVDTGLADTLGSMDTAIEQALSLADQDSTHISSTFSTTSQKENTMKFEKLSQIKTAADVTAAFPDPVNTIRQEAMAAVNTEDLQVSAASAERERILGLAQVQFGADAGKAFADIVATGVTIEQFTAIRGAAPQPAQENAAEAATRQSMLDAITQAGADNPGAGDPPDTGGKDFNALVAEHRLQYKCSLMEAQKAVRAAHPKAYNAYMKKLNPKV